MKRFSKMVLTSGLIFAAGIYLIYRGFETRTPRSHEGATVKASKAGEFSLLENLRVFRANLKAGRFTEANCSEFLDYSFDTLVTTPLDQYRPIELKHEAKTMARELWLAKLEIRERLAAFLEDGVIDPGCEQSIRNLFRAGRFAEDYLAERHFEEAREPASSGGGPVPPPVSAVFKGDEPQLLLNPKYDRFPDLRSGDVLLSRGNAFTSAAIARLTVPPSQFSHLAIVYREPKSGQLLTVEAHIEVGVVIAPLDTYLRDGKVRAALFRHPDAELAARAAEAIADVVTKHRARTGKNLPYDFAMDLKTRGSLFCSEVVNYAFDLATGGALSVPVLPSKLDGTNRAFIERLGIRVKESFIPTDIQLDPRFEYVAEWRDVSRVREALHKDAILSSMYRWMGDFKYQLKPSLKSLVAGNLLLPVRRAPVVGDALLEERFPAYIPKSTLETILEVEQVAGLLDTGLVAEDARVRESRGLPMHSMEMLAFLESWRERDLVAYRERPLDPRGSDFHGYFRP